MQNIINCEGFEFGFDPTACQRCGGHCCTGESGYIFLNPDEVSALAQYLNIPRAEFLEQFTYKVGVRTSLKEKPDLASNGYACVFFDQNKRQCAVYEARPAQCRSFPFWRGISKEELAKECIGVILH